MSRSGRKKREIVKVSRKNWVSIFKWTSICSIFIQLVILMFAYVKFAKTYASVLSGGAV